MKLTAVDLEPSDFKTINSPEKFGLRLSADDVRLSMQTPIVLKFDFMDMGQTPYGFDQVFSHDDTLSFFNNMKLISSNTIVELSANARKFHFYRSEIKGNLYDVMKDYMPEAIRAHQIVYHLELYTNDDASR